MKKYTTITIKHEGYEPVTLKISNFNITINNPITDLSKETQLNKKLEFSCIGEITMSEQLKIDLMLLKGKKNK